MHCFTSSKFLSPSLGVDKSANSIPSLFVVTFRIIIFISTWWFSCSLQLLLFFAVLLVPLDSNHYKLVSYLQAKDLIFHNLMCLHHLDLLSNTLPSAQESVAFRETWGTPHCLSYFWEEVALSLLWFSATAGSQLLLMKGSWVDQ